MKLYLDIQNHRLVGGLNDPSQIQTPEWILRDILPMTIYVVEPAADQTNGYYEAVEIQAGRELKFGIKTAAALSGGFLVQALTFTHSADDDGNDIYTADVNFATAALIAAVGATDLEVLGEFVQVDAYGNNYDSVQFDAIVIPDVYRGTESTVTLQGSPHEYFRMVAPNGDVYEFRVDNDGELQKVRIA